MKSFFAIRQAIYLGLPVTQDELNCAKKYAKNRRESNSRVVNIMIIIGVSLIVFGLVYRYFET